MSNMRASSSSFVEAIYPSADNRRFIGSQAGSGFDNEDEVCEDDKIEVRNFTPVWRSVVWILLFGAVTTVIPGLLAYFFRPQLLSVIQWIKQQGFIGYVYFDLFMIGWIVLCLPSTPIELVCGFLFGIYRSFILSITAKTLGSFFSFLIGKYLLHKFINKKISNSNKLLYVVSVALQESPFRILLLVRLTALPLAVKNYGLSALEISNHIFLLSTFIGSIPYSLAWTYFGSISKDLFQILGFENKGEIANDLERHDQIVKYSIEACGILAIVIFVLVMRHYSNKAFAKVHDAHDQRPLLKSTSRISLEIDSCDSRVSRQDVDSILVKRFSIDTKLK